MRHRLAVTRARVRVGARAEQQPRDLSVAALRRDVKWCARSGLLVGKARVGEGFEEEIRRNPWYAESHYNLGILWSRLGRLDDAVREWERAIEVDPDYALPHEILARYYQDRDPERYAHYLGQLSRLGVPAPH